jgi:hypothetical protein
MQLFFSWEFTGLSVVVASGIFSSMFSTMRKLSRLSFVHHRKGRGMVRSRTLVSKVGALSKRWVKLCACGGVVNVGRHCPSLDEG